VRRQHPYCGLAIIAVLIVILLFGFSQAGHFLALSSQEPIKADLIVALGGDSGGRIKKVAELFNESLAPTILLTGMEGGAAETRSYYLNWRARFLEDRGVPKSRLLFDAVSANSWEEALNTLRLMQKRDYQRVLVVSDPPHLRRLAWVWGKVFDGSGKEYRLIAARADYWNPDRWWRDDKSSHFVITELIKLVYYYVAH
jgi:uncharacterized SAM-binding protein YcdF (DUF218 family)